ncbi:MAG: hypothetical protein RR249_07550 [Tannerellaceae bacterium]
MDKLALYFCLLLALTLQSCCGENLPECPPDQYLVQVFVKDKNYFNVDQTKQSGWVDEGLPFKSYLSSVYYELRKLDSDELILKSDVMPVDHNNDYHTIYLENIPFGKYTLTVWGNMMAEVPAGYLHYNQAEHTDLYLAMDTLELSTTFQTTTLLLERTKGKLVLICDNFPPEITQIKQSLSPLYESVSHRFEYRGNTSVSKTSPVAPMLETVLAPSVDKNTTMLSLQLISGEKEPSAIRLPDIPLFFRRNEVTRVKVDFDSLIKVWNLCLFIDGKWTIVNQLQIR